MNTKNILLRRVIPIAVFAALAFTGFGMTVSADTSFNFSKDERKNERKDDRKEDKKSSVGLVGTVTAVNGTTLTVVGIRGGNGMATSTYTVDASSAVILETNPRGTSTLSAIQLGDRIFVKGTTTASTTIGAKFIVDGVGKFFKKMGHGIRGWFNWGDKDNRGDK